MIAKLWPVVAISSVCVLSLLFQNCGPGDGFGAKQQYFFNTETGTFTSQIEDSSTLTRQRQLRSLPNNKDWQLLWEEQFDGPAGATVRPPWHYKHKVGAANSHRDGILTKQDAYLTGDSKLKMQVVNRNGKANSSYLRTFPFGRDHYNVRDGLPDQLLLGQDDGELYIEVSVRLDKAYQTEDAWWAFWLFAPTSWDANSNQLYPDYKRFNNPRLDPYDGNAQTGMEVDVFEYVPYLGKGSYESRNGFNAAAYTSVNPKIAKHIINENKGFIADINKHLGVANSPNQMNLTDGNYHKLGLYWSPTKYEFYINGVKFWQISDPKFITKSTSLALILSWEVENGLWGDQVEKTFVNSGGLPYVLVDYVRVYSAF